MQSPFPTHYTERPLSAEDSVASEPLEAILKRIACDLMAENEGEPPDLLLLVLSKIFVSHFVFLLELATPGSPHPHSHRLTLAARGEIWSSATFELNQSACARSLETGFLNCPHGARLQFPEDSLLTALEIESLLACPVSAHGGQPLGVFGLLGRSESRTSQATAESVLQIYSSHMAAGIDCRRARQSLAAEKARSGTAEARLKRNNLESLGNAASEIAHDFNNLLTAVLGNLSLALRSRGLSAQLCEQLTAAKSAGLRAHELAQQLHFFAAAAAPVKTRAAVGELVRDTFSSLEGVAGSVVVPAELWIAEIDRAQIGQALHNVSLYARKCIPAGTPMEVACTNLTIEHDDPRLALDAGHYVVISFKKQGDFPDDDSSESGIALQNQGSDLSIVAARSIIHGHGGLIRSNARPGTGIVFEIFLPAVPEKALVPFPATVLDKSIEGSRILVVDDEEALCELLADALEPLGCEVCNTQDGNEALSLYGQAMREGRPFNLVITDLLMPFGIDGLELVRGLQTLDPQVRVIVSSGHSTDPVVVYYREHGFCGVLSKPYDLAELERVVKAAMLPTDTEAAPAAPTTSDWTVFPKAHALLA
ncbi:MAG: domain S-box [Chthoniobacteraceae bacterium]|nr:domain S-box [Chthoniobacteraceae bacterium]